MAGSVSRCEPVVSRRTGPAGADAETVSRVVSIGASSARRPSPSATAATAPANNHGQLQRRPPAGSASAGNTAGRGTLVGATKREPRRGTVSTNLGESAESPSTSRRRLTAAFSPCSKSTKVSSGQSRLRSSSRVTSSPGRSSRTERSCSGCCWRLRRVPDLRSSPRAQIELEHPERDAVRRVFRGFVHGPETRGL